MKGKTATSCPRKKKPVDRAKKVSKISYAENCPLVKVESINPIQILGARALWVYNTKTRKIGNYISIDEYGLDVVGNTIRNFNASSSECIVMKDAELNLEKFHKLSEKVRRKRFDSLKSMKIKLKGRMNDNIILLCVDK
jgi:hypothetical protein